MFPILEKICHAFIHRMKWRHSNLWSYYDLYVVGQYGVLCKVKLCVSTEPKWSDKGLWCYSNKIESVGLRKYPYYHYLTKKVMPQKQFSELAPHHGGKAAGVVWGNLVTVARYIVAKSKLSKTKRIERARPTSYKCSAVAEIGDRLATIDMGRKFGDVLPLFLWGGPHVTQCGLGWGLPSYQVASLSNQPFGTIDVGRKLGGDSAPFFGRLELCPI